MELPEPDRAEFVEVNRTRLRVWEWGDVDRPVVLCVHGAHDHGRMWDELAPRLASTLDSRVVAVDLRGHGDSGRVGSGHMWQAATLDLGLLAEHLGSPVGIVGHSFGAGLSMWAAAVWPERFQWVVNIDGLGPPGPAEDPAARDLAADTARAFSYAKRAMTSPARRYATLDEMVERRAGVNTRLPRSWVEHLVAHGSIEDEGGFRWKADPVCNVGFAGPFSPAAIEAEHRALRRPLLAITGGEVDTWSDLPPELIAERLSCFADARHVEIGGAGHYVHIEAPDAVHDAIGRFVTEVSP